MQTWQKFVLIAVVALFLFLGATTMAEARPVRNNNPGDLRWDGVTRWDGQIGVDAAPGGPFVRFANVEKGIRANTIAAIHYFNRDGIETLREFGNRWAPPVDNGGSSAYGLNLAADLGVDPDQSFDWQGRLQDLMTAIFRNEDFANPVVFEPAVVAQGIADAKAQTGIA